MGARSDIEWTDATWNPTRGCSRVSPGCQHCYAERLARRFTNPGGAYEGLLHKSGAWNGTVVLASDHLTDPLYWVKPRRIFVDSMSDLFHEAIPFEYVDKVFAVMACTQRHTYQILTKRPKRMVEYFERLRWDGEDWNEEVRRMGGREIAGCPDQVRPTEVWPQWQPSHGHRAGYDCCGATWPLDNVHLGVSCEDQSTADERIEELRKVPAKVRFLSCEPLLGQIILPIGKIMCGFPQHITRDGRSIGAPLSIHWVIAGGESGHDARPMHPDWARSLRDQCQEMGVAFFFKQWGTWSPGECALQPPSRTERTATWWNGEWHFGRQTSTEECHRDDEPDLFALGKKGANRLLDGRTWDEFPR